jgi:hypothetical protein
MGKVLVENRYEGKWQRGEKKRWDLIGDGSNSRKKKIYLVEGGAPNDPCWGVRFPKEAELLLISDELIKSARPHFRIRPITHYYLAWDKEPKVDCDVTVAWPKLPKIGVFWATCPKDGFGDEEVMDPKVCGLWREPNDDVPKVGTGCAGEPKADAENPVVPKEDDPKVGTVGITLGGGAKVVDPKTGIGFAAVPLIEKLPNALPKAAGWLIVPASVDGMLDIGWDCHEGTSMAPLVIMASDCWTDDTKWLVPNGVGAGGTTSAGADVAKDIGAGVADNEEGLPDKSAFPKADSLGVGDNITGADEARDSVGRTVEDRVPETVAGSGIAVPSSTAGPGKALFSWESTLPGMISGTFATMDDSFGFGRPIDSKEIASPESETAVDMEGVVVVMGLDGWKLGGLDNRNGVGIALSTLETGGRRVVEVGMPISVAVTLGGIEYIGSGKRSAFVDAWILRAPRESVGTCSETAWLEGRRSPLDIAASGSFFSSDRDGKENDWKLSKGSLFGAISVEGVVDDEADPSSRLEIACEPKPAKSKVNGVLENANGDSFFAPSASTADGCTGALAKNKKEAWRSSMNEPIPK